MKNLYVMLTLMALAIGMSFSSSAEAGQEQLIQCTRNWMDAPDFDRGVEINRCIRRYARGASFKTCLTAARFIDNDFDWGQAARQCLISNNVSSPYQCDSLNGEFRQSGEYDNILVDDCYYALSAR